MSEYPTHVEDVSPAYVMIPRAQLEALMAAADILAEYVADGHCPNCKGQCTEGAVEPLCVLTKADEALAALRAAGIGGVNG